MGEVQAPKLAVGLALKDFVISSVFADWNFPQYWFVCGKIGKEVKFQSSQISGLNRTLTEGCQKPGERSVTPAFMLSFKTENLCI